MRQALIVTNPKWEPFTAASDKFKALKEGVLVTRGRGTKEKTIKSSEKKIIKKAPETAKALAIDLLKAGVKPEEIEKQVKAFKPIKAAAAALLLFFSLMLPAFAQQSIIGNMPATLLEPATTNGVGAGFIGWNRDQIATIQISINSTNVAHISTRSNIFVKFDTSVNGTDWQSYAYQIVVPITLTANAATNTIARLTNSVGGQYLRIGSIENANTNRQWIERAHLLIQ